MGWLDWLGRLGGNPVCDIVDDIVFDVLFVIEFFKRVGNGVVMSRHEGVIQAFV